MSKLKQGIGIVTWYGGEESFLTLINSIPVSCPYPICIVVNGSDKAGWVDEWTSTYGRDNALLVKVPYDGYELGAIKIILEVTDWDEFIFLQDTIEIIDPSIFKKLFDDFPGESVCYNGVFQMYLGKFRREVLEQMEFPLIENKLAAIMHEYEFAKAYSDIDSPRVFNPLFNDEVFIHDPDNYEQRWGRLNLVLRDNYIIKRKGSWTREHIDKIASDLGAIWEGRTDPLIRTK